MQISNIRTSIRLFLLSIAIIFTIELLVMFFLGRLRVTSVFAASLLDSSILVAILFPILYKINKKLYEEVSARGRAEEAVRMSYDMQSVVNRLLRLSLENISFDKLLEQAINLVLSLPWIAFESKGAIFIAENGSNILKMKAQKGLSGFVQKSCGRLPFGDCLCGLAASEQKTQFADHVDDRHRITYEGIIPHGHYCAPIVYAGKTLGVINMYTKKGHARNQNEEDFLNMVANTMAGIIVRRQAEEGLKTAYAQLQETQDQLIQAEKLNAIGQLASGVAHEVRNPLGIILQGVEYLEASATPGGKSILEAVSMIKDSVKRADNIISLLFEFSKAARLDLKAEDINSIVESSISLVKTKFKFVNIGIVKELEEDIPRILVDRNKMEQVFINVLLNAIHAMPKGGKITIRGYVKELKQIGNGIGRREGDSFRAGEKALMVEIKDTGTGIAEENIKKIFNPFFTTKGPGGGAGLGLSVSRSIIIMHKGFIDASSRVGEGTTITITLPVPKG